MTARYYMPTNVAVHWVGLIPVSGYREEYPLVKAKCHYDVEDVYTIATLVQEYYSDALVDRDVNYSFPLPPDAAVCSFKAVIDDVKVIEGVVKEKGDAKREYKRAVAAGKTAGLLEQAHEDIFKVSLGNIKPGQKVAVHITFVSIIGHDASSPTTLRLMMPITIAPRYGAPPRGVTVPRRSNEFDLTVAIHMTQTITSISSSTHQIALQLGTASQQLVGEFQPSKAFVSMHTPVLLEQDIVITISSQKLDVPRCLVERLDNEGTSDAIALTLVPRFDLPPLSAQNYIFLVDRSGSMRGSRIRQVKTAMQIMLKSLPTKNTKFNILSFGTDFSSLWPSSVAYNSENVASASSQVDNFAANYGGTELARAFGNVFNILDKEPVAMPTTMFVLTDGEAWDMEGVRQQVESGVLHAKERGRMARVFVLGVGNSVSRVMCDAIARVGRGVGVYVADDEKPDAKLMGLLRASRGGVIEDLTVDWGSPEFEPIDEGFEVIDDPKPSLQAAPATISLFTEGSNTSGAPPLGPEKAIINLGPAPRIQQAPKTEKLPIPLYPGFRCSIFAIIRQSSPNTPISNVVTIKGTVMGSPVVLHVPVTRAQVATSLGNNKGLVHTLAAKALVQELEDQPQSGERDAQIERLGLTYSLTTSMTSFLAINQEENDKADNRNPTDYLIDEASPKPLHSYNPYPVSITRRSRSRSYDRVYRRSVSRSRSPSRRRWSRSRSRSPTRVICQSSPPVMFYSRRSRSPESPIYHPGIVVQPGSFQSHIRTCRASRSRSPKYLREGTSYTPVERRVSSRCGSRSRSRERSRERILIIRHSASSGRSRSPPPPHTIIFEPSLTSPSHDALQGTSVYQDNYQTPLRRGRSRSRSHSRSCSRSRSRSRLPEAQLIGRPRSRSRSRRRLRSSPRAQAIIVPPEPPTIVPASMAMTSPVVIVPQSPIVVCGPSTPQPLQQSARYSRSHSRDRRSRSRSPEARQRNPKNGFQRFIRRFIRSSRSPSRRQSRERNSSSTPNPSIHQSTRRPSRSWSPPIIPQIDTKSTNACILTVEYIARAQRFDGGYDLTEDFIKVISGISTIPQAPSSLVSLFGGPKEVRDSIWAALLALAVLEKKFGASEDRQGWEMFAEKSISFVEDALLDSFDINDTTTYLIDWKAEAAKYV